MDSQAPRQALVLHHLPLLPEAEIKTLLAEALPEAQLTPQDILLRKKEDRYQAFLMAPAQHAHSIASKK